MTSRVQQLIDLNEDLTNFKLRFTLNSKNGEEFDMAIADQYTIDNSPEEIVFKKVKNTISGTIVSDKDVFQNHFLILKSSGENKAEVEVSINKQEIPPNPEAVAEAREQAQAQAESQAIARAKAESEEREQSVQQQREREQEPRQDQKMRTVEQFENVEKTTWIDIRLILIILICILGGIFVYNFLSKKTGITTNLTSQQSPTMVPVPPATSIQQQFSFKPTVQSSMNMNLLNKLNSNIPLGQ
jgi:hypothetical protein